VDSDCSVVLLIGRVVVLLLGLQEDDVDVVVDDDDNDDDNDGDNDVVENPWAVKNIQTTSRRIQFVGFIIVTG